MIMKTFTPKKGANVFMIMTRPAEAPSAWGGEVPMGLERSGQRAQ